MRSIDREIAAASPSNATEPNWIAWRAPMVDGDRDMCSWYNTTRGMYMDDGMVYVSGTGIINSERLERPQITPPKGPVPLEGGTSVVVLARLIGGRVERLRTVGDDCPMDAGGRTVYWLDSITPAESIRFLAALAQAGPSDRTMYENDRRVAETAVRAIGYHRDASADATLDRIAADHRDSGIRRQAASTLTSLRGAHGVTTVTRLLSTSKDADDRRSLTSALGQSRDASAVPALRSLISDPDEKVRSEAVYYFIQRGGLAVVPDALKSIAADKADTVRRRAVYFDRPPPGRCRRPATPAAGKGHLDGRRHAQGSRQRTEPVEGRAGDRVHGRNTETIGLEVRGQRSEVKGRVEPLTSDL